MDRIQAELGEYSKGVQGHVRVFVSMSAIAEFLPEDIGIFRRKHAHVRISLEEHVSSDVVRGVADGRVELGGLLGRSRAAEACKPFHTAAITSRSCRRRAIALANQQVAVRCRGDTIELRA